MWFKNLKLYRLAPNTELALDALQRALEAHAFQPGSSQDPQASGWVSPRGDDRLVYAANGQLLLRLHTEKKLLPASVVRQAAQERAVLIEAEQGYRPGRKQMKELREQMTQELLPRAFVIGHDTHVWIDEVHGWVAIDAAATAHSDEVLGLLSKTITPFPVVPLHVQQSPASAMTRWLFEDDAPAGFSIDQETELRATGESRATVRYVHQSVDVDEVRRHIEDGKQCTRLAMTWNDRVSFVLTDSLDIKRVAPLDVLKEHEDVLTANEAERLDADWALMTGELAQLLDALVVALGGLQEA